MKQALHKAKQIIPPVLKTVVIVGCIATLYFQWQEQPPSIENIWQRVRQLPSLLLPSLLMISLASWLLESKKWQILVDDFSGIRFRESVLQNLTAQAASFVTPLRGGEFVAKAYYFPQNIRKQITQRVFVANFCQMSVTIILGTTGVLFYDLFEIDAAYFVFIALSLIMIIAISTYLWIIKKFKMVHVSKEIWVKTLLFSFLRYLVFSSNWFIVLYALGYQEPIFTTAVAVAITYLAVSILPLIQLLDMPARILIATTLFAGSSELVIAAVSIIWMTNTVFPTLLGCVLLPFRTIQLNPA